MQKVLFFLTLVLSLSTWAQEGLVLRTGDVLLQPLKCWACSLIEAEEETIYSHIGVVLAVSPEVLIGEAFGTVRKISLAEFNKKTEAAQKIMVLRFRNEEISNDIEIQGLNFLKTFETEFQDAKYDHDFRWNNFDEQGNEKFYCSELVSKLFAQFLRLETPIKRMHFNANRENWMTYFRGNIPDNEWGNSPGDFERSELFYQVGEL